MKKKICDICKEKESEFENYMDFTDGKEKDFCASCYLYNAFVLQCTITSNMTRIAEYYQNLCIKSGIIQPERLSEKDSMKEKKDDLRDGLSKLIETSRVCDSLNHDNI